MSHLRSALQWLATALGSSSWRVGLLVFLWALGLRLGFALLTAGTFDVDEFVVLVLSRAVAQGAVPYRDVVFFHPLGMLFLFAGLQRLVAWWWPSGRAVIMLIDSMTAVLVWRIGKELFTDSKALVAGLVYAASPIALVSSVRIGPDPIITALGALGLLLLLGQPSRRGAIGAGICLGLAVWTKFPALLYLPIYFLAAPRRALSFLLAWSVTVLCLFAPFLPEAHAVFSQTVLWQLAHRMHTDLVHRLSAVGAYWLLLNPLAVLALLRRRQAGLKLWRPLWLPLGFCLGGAFLFTAQAYYHYFAIVTPFAALLAAPLVTSLVRHSSRLLAVCALGLTCLWGADVGNGDPALRLFVSASRLSAVQQTAAILDRTTLPTAAVLTDRFEYALFAHRALATDYFWNMDTMVQAGSLEHRVSLVAAVVTTKGEQTYPSGFADYLEDSNYPRIQTAKTTVWLVRSPSTGGSHNAG